MMNKLKVLFYVSVGLAIGVGISYLYATYTLVKIGL